MLTMTIECVKRMRRGCDVCGDAFCRWRCFEQRAKVDVQTRTLVKTRKNAGQRCIAARALVSQGLWRPACIISPRETRSLGGLSHLSLTTSMWVFDQVQPTGFLQGLVLAINICWSMCMVMSPDQRRSRGGLECGRREKEGGGKGGKKETGREEGK